MAEIKNGPNHTDNHYYRIQSEPKVISALGRVLWNTLYVEDLLSCLLRDAGRDMKEMRTLSSAPKVAELNALKSEVAGWGAPDLLLGNVQRAIDTFNYCRKLYKDAIAIEKVYFEGRANADQSHTELKLASAKRRYIKDAENLHRIAGEIEDAINPINTARIALSDYWKKQLKQRDKFKIATNGRHFLIRSELQRDATIFFTFVNGYGIFFRVNNHGDMKAVNPSRKIDKELLDKIASKIEEHGL